MQHAHLTLGRHWHNNGHVSLSSMCSQVTSRSGTHLQLVTRIRITATTALAPPTQEEYASRRERGNQPMLTHI
eukprot:scaffold313314_cov30-Tisochrysis_lutea.AAC.1